jgi:HK97 family phage major capsid protein
MKKSLRDALKEQFKQGLAPLMLPKARKSDGGDPPDGHASEKDLSLCKLIRGYLWGNWEGAKKELDYWRESRKAMGEETGAGGGFIVPSVTANEIIELLRAKAVIRKLGAIIVSGMKSGQQEMPRQDSGSRGYWVGENKKKTESEVGLGMLQVLLKEVAALVKLPNSLIEDSSPAADTIVKNDLGLALALAEDFAFITGTGASMPLGLLNFPGIGTTDLTGALGYDDLIDAETAIETLNGSYTGWLMHPRSKGTIRKIKDGDGRYIWEASGKLGTPDSLLGLPCNYSTQVPTTLTVGKLTNTSPIILGDYGQFMIFEKAAGIRLDVSGEAGDAFEYDQTWFRGVKRVDCAVRQVGCFHIIRGVR